MGGFGHYTQLVRQLPPGALLRAMARRAQGVVRRATWKRLPGGSLPQVLASHGVTSPEALVSAALDGRRGQTFCEVSRRAEVLAALDRVEGARERTIARAEAAAQGTYDVFGVSVSFGEGLPIDWSLDPVSGYRYPLRDAAALELSPAGVDPKAPWVMGRLDCLVALAQGAWAAREPALRERFSRAAVSRIGDFLRANPVGIGIHWTCPMEVALRAVNLAQTLVMLQDSAELREPSFFGQAMSALADHMGFVAAHLEDTGAVPNNHLLANLTGLWLVHQLFPLLPAARERQSAARAGLEAEVANQVHPEGSSFEGSVPYHRLSLELLTLCEVAAGAGARAFSPRFRERLHGMYRVAERLSSASGRAPQLGDNDSGRAFPWATRASLDFSYLPPLGAALFEDPALKREGTALPDEAVWLLGSDGLARYEALAAEAGPRSESFPLAGWHVLSGGGAHVVVSAGRLGQRGVGGHSHNDALSFELHVGGAPVVVDPGSVTYTRDPAVRNALRSTAAHNTVEVDGEEINPIDPNRLFSLADQSNARAEVFQRGAEIDRLIVAHDGYRRLENGGTLERTLILDKRERALSVVDAFFARGEHTLTSRLHFADRDASLVPLPEEIAARLSRVPEAPRAFAPKAVRLSTKEGECFVVFEAGVIPQLEETCLSEGYGLLRPARRVVWSTAVSGESRQRWAIAFG